MPETLNKEAVSANNACLYRAGLPDALGKVVQVLRTRKDGCKHQHHCVSGNLPVGLSHEHCLMVQRWLQSCRLYFFTGTVVGPQVMLSAWVGLPRLSFS